MSTIKRNLDVVKRIPPASGAVQKADAPDVEVKMLAGRYVVGGREYTDLVQVKQAFPGRTLVLLKPGYVR